MITVAELKAQARIDTDAEDALLAVYVAAAVASVAAYVTDTAPAETVKHAELSLAAMMYRERDGSNEYAVPEKYGYGYLPLGVTAMLYPYRKPSVA